jgi:hypothetical protein
MTKGAPMKIVELTEKDIETWALDPKNRERARALGMRLISNQDASKLKGLPSLGEFEDRATEWASKNSMAARLLVMRLVPKLM